MDLDDLGDVLGRDVGELLLERRDERSLALERPALVLEDAVAVRPPDAGALLALGGPRARTDLAPLVGAEPLRALLDGLAPDRLVAQRFQPPGHPRLRAAQLPADLLARHALSVH